MGNLFLHMDLNSLLTQGVRKFISQKSESPWSFMSVTAKVSSGSYLKYKWIHPNSLSIPPAHLSPVPVPQNICYWFQLLSESREVIGWENDSVYQSRAGSPIFWLLAQHFFLQSSGAQVWHLLLPALPRRAHLSISLLRSQREPPWFALHLSWTSALFTAIWYKGTAPNLFCRIDQCIPHEWIYQNLWLFYSALSHYHWYCHS